MPWRTRMFKDYPAWVKAGRPVGGVFPVEPGEYHPRHGQRWPARYMRNGVPIGRHYYIALPGGQTWCPWMRAYNGTAGWHGEGWTVKGPPDRMTITPSIETHDYHGYVERGVIGNDLGGRRYDERGRVIA